MGPHENHDKAGKTFRPAIGVYVCHCGQNIASRVDIGAVVSFAAGLPSVSASREYKFMCSDPGQNLIKEDLRSGLVNRVLVASCTPLMHETTFRKAGEDGGINPFLVQMANIREHVSWVTDDTDKATLKAKALISAGVARLRRHVPLERRRLPVRQEVVIIGAGVAGLSAALAIAEAGKKVFLVEKEPSIGGHMGYFDKTFPTLDCAACTLTPRMVRAGSHPNIEILSMSEVTGISGRTGDYTLKLKKRPRYIDEEKCNGCGACWSSCPAVRVPARRVITIGGKPIGESTIERTCK
ncbi:MAG: FAD-dependent oxidoreductase [Pseudomonadota bacterium]